MSFILKHPLFVTLRELKGNARASVYTEVLFGVPFAMFNSFFSVYMLGLGLNDQQIGTIASLGLVSQVVGAFLSGAIVDKFGRRWTLFFSDLLSWSIPLLIWAVAKDVRYFVVAALLNGFWRLSHTAWTCLTMEDAEERHLLHIWTWISIFMFVTAVFIIPGRYFVERYGLDAAMRGMLLLGFVFITAKVVLLLIFSTETKRGVQRLQETKHRSILSLLGEYRSVFGKVFRMPAVLAALGLMVVTNAFTTISTSFWSVLLTQKLGFTNAEFPLYFMARSVVTTLAFFVLGPRMTNPRQFRCPLWLAFGGQLVAQGLLVFMPARSFWLLGLSVALEGLGAALASPMTESMLSISLESDERARVSAIVYVMLILVISPVGWIAGQLSSMDRSLPFVLNMGLFALGGVLVWLISRGRFFEPKAA